MIVREYRIIMPLTVDEVIKYQIGQLYTVAQASLDETGGGEGIEVLQNEPFDGVPLFGGRYTRGQYTRKIYRLTSKVSWWIRKLVPRKSLIAIEEAWNAYPYCKTVATSQNEDYVVTVESLHLPDRGTTENALELPPDLLAKRKVEYVDISGKPICEKDYKREFDPRLFKSTKTGRGPLSANWTKTQEPVMCCYKVVTVEVKGWALLRNRIQNYLAREYPRLFQRFNRQVFCTADQWHGMTLEDVRALEKRTKKELDRQRTTKSTRGAPAPDDE